MMEARELIFTREKKIAYIGCVGKITEKREKISFGEKNENVYVDDAWSGAAKGRKKKDRCEQQGKD